MQQYVVFLLRSLVILFLSGLVLGSCQPAPIDVDVAPHDTRVVVSAQVIPSSIMLVSLTRSFSALSDSKNGDTVKTDFVEAVAVSNAKVTVSYAGRTDSLFMLVPGIYASISTLQVTNSVYTLHVTDTETGREVSATSVMLPPVKFDTVFPSIRDSLVSVNYTLTDIPGTDNWYMINYYLKVPDTTGNTDVNTFFPRGSNKLLADFELLSDKTFDSDGKRVTKVDLRGVNPTDTIAVTVSNISEGYFKFLSAYKRTGNILSQLTSEPIDFPSNVLNGFGYFSTHYPDVRYFNLRDY
jgi:hypothetical protein